MALKSTGFGWYGLDLNPVTLANFGSGAANLRYNLQRISDWIRSAETRIGQISTQTGGETDTPSEPTASGDASANGTPNYIAKFITAKSLGDASAIEDGSKLFVIDLPLGLTDNYSLYWAASSSATSLSAESLWNTADLPRLDFKVSESSRFGLTRQLNASDWATYTASSAWRAARFDLDETLALTGTPAAATYQGISGAGSFTVNGVGTGSSLGPQKLATQSDYETNTFHDFGDAARYGWNTSLGRPQFHPTNVGISGGQIAQCDADGDSDLALRVRANGTVYWREGCEILANTTISQNLSLSTGSTYRYSFYCRVAPGTNGNYLYADIICRKTATSTTYYVSKADNTWTEYTGLGTSAPQWQDGVDETGLWNSPFVITIPDVNKDNTYRQYYFDFVFNPPVTFETDVGVRLRIGSKPNPPSYTTLLSYDIDRVSLNTVTPSTLSAAVTWRYLDISQATLVPTAASSNSVTVPEMTGAYLVPKLAPVVSATSGAATVTVAYGSQHGLAYDSDDVGGTLSVPAAYSSYHHVPEVGSIKYSIGAAGNVAIRSGSELHLFESTNAYRNAIKTSASQAANLTYTLPTSLTNGYYLKTDGSGNLSWAAVATGTVKVYGINVTSPSTSWSVLASAHQLGTGPLIVQCYDASLGATRNVIIPSQIAIDASNNVTVSWEYSQAGSIVIMG